MSSRVNLLTSARRGLLVMAGFAACAALGAAFARGVWSQPPARAAAGPKPTMTIVQSSAPRQAGLAQAAAAPSRLAEAPNTEVHTALTTKIVRTSIVRPNGEIIANPESQTLDSRSLALAKGLTREPVKEAAAPLLKQAASVVTVAPIEAPAPVLIAAAAASPPNPAPNPQPAPQNASPAEDATATIPLQAEWSQKRLPQSAFYAQLAASSNEEEAQKTAASLQTQLSSVLGTQDWLIVPAMVRDVQMFRVRIAAASREEASRLCARIKGARAACYVAHD